MIIPLLNFLIAAIISSPINFTANWTSLIICIINILKSNVNQTEAFFLVSVCPTNKESFQLGPLHKGLFHQPMFYGIIRYFGTIFHPHLSQGADTVGADGFNAERQLACDFCYGFSRCNHEHHLVFSI
jgi:hypothetical protein